LPHESTRGICACFIDITTYRISYVVIIQCGNSVLSAFARMLHNGVTFTDPMAKNRVNEKRRETPL